VPGSYGAELLTKNVQIPPLTVGGNYLLQGTFYYCREGKEALCFLMSAEGKISVQESGANTVEWNLVP